MSLFTALNPVLARDADHFETSPDQRFGEVSIPIPQPETYKKQSLSQRGTRLAIDIINSGVPAHSVSAQRRGGARNRADRESHALTTSQIHNLKAATQHAGVIGLPFNRMITIHWEAAGMPLDRMPWATGRFIDLLSKTVGRHGSNVSWLWLHENAPGKGHTKGGHCHILLHVPAELVPTVTARQIGWLRRITGAAYRRRVIKSDPIGERLGLEKSNPELHAINLAAAFYYGMKGASDEAATRFALELHKAGGRVIGKRCGTSQNIGKKARQLAATAYPPLAAILTSRSEP